MRETLAAGVTVGEVPPPLVVIQRDASGPAAKTIGVAT